MIVRQAHIWLLGNRNYPERLVKLPEDLVGSLPDLITNAQRLNPGVTPTPWYRRSGDWARIGSGRICFAASQSACPSSHEQA